MLRSIARSDPATAVTLSMHSHLVAAQVWRHHHGPRRRPRRSRRSLAGCAILVSTGASDWVGSNGTARRVDGGYRVGARKAPASGCEVGTVLVTSFRWDEAPEGPQVLHCSVPFAAPGVSIDLTWDTSAAPRPARTRSWSTTCSCLTRRSRWPGLRTSGIPMWNTVLGAALPLIMSAYLGIGTRRWQRREQPSQDAPSSTSSSCSVRCSMPTPPPRTWSPPCTSTPTTSTSTTPTSIAGRMLSRKTVATDAVIETVRLAIETTGGLGYTRSSDLERLYRTRTVLSSTHSAGRSRRRFPGEWPRGSDRWPDSRRTPRDGCRGRTILLQSDDEDDTRADDECMVTRSSALIAAVALFVGLGLLGDTPDTRDSTSQVASYFVAHSTSVLAGAVLLGVAVAALVVFAASLGNRVSQSAATVVATVVLTALVLPYGRARVRGRGGGEQRSQAALRADPRSHAGARTPLALLVGSAGLAAFAAHRRFGLASLVVATLMVVASVSFAARGLLPRRPAAGGVRDVPRLAGRGRGRPGNADEGGAVQGEAEQHGV